MQEFKGTPGPWRIVEAGRNSVYAAYVLGPDEDQGVADILGHPDAHLIAAAPIMAEYIAKRASLGDTEAIQILEVAGIAIAKEAP